VAAGGRNIEAKRPRGGKCRDPCK